MRCSAVGLCRSVPTSVHPTTQELLFRCALLPAVGADWRGVSIAAAVFGVLHISGGRSVAFAAWATAVGLGYGALAVGLRDGSAPMIAHVLANAAGALLWRAANPDKLLVSAAPAAASDVVKAPASRAAPDRPAWWRSSDDAPDDGKWKP